MGDAQPQPAPDRNLALDLLRVTEARTASGSATAPARPRHDDLVADVRAAGARIQFISDGDVADDALFAVTGITDGEVVRGVRYGAGTAVTDSIVMRAKSGTVRRVTATHRLDRLAGYSAVDYEHPTSARVVAGIHREDDR